jgi:hypothetical protein
MALQGHMLVSFVVIALFAAAAVVASDGENEHHGMSAPIDLVPAAPGASLAERARDDRRRHAYITSVLLTSRGGLRRAVISKPVRRAAEVAFSMPLSSGAYSGTGQFLARVNMGTPVQQFLLVADTGTDLTWIKCHGPSDASSPPGKAFRPADSRTWAPVPCSLDTCKLDVPFSLANCSGHDTPCTYDYR